MDKIKIISPIMKKTCSECHKKFIVKKELQMAKNWKCDRCREKQ